jgi:hypothetical protein
MDTITRYIRLFTYGKLLWSNKEVIITLSYLTLNTSLNLSLYLGRKLQRLIKDDRDRDPFVLRRNWVLIQN